MNTNWVPSHVQVTIHQARSLLLKSKNGGSELYTCVQVEKEKFLTGSVARQTEPEWNHTTDIPLMSFDTTLHFTVKQSGRIGDDFIGYIAIPLGGFNISSKKSVTHWYKLGSKPGKPNTKLRGDLLLTIRFVSKWMSAADDSANKDKVLVNGDLAAATRPNGVMLKRSKSDLKMKSRDSERLLEKQSSKEKLGIFRRSFKKRSKSPVVEECEDDFTSFTLSTHTPVTPPDVRRRSQTMDVRVHTTSSGSGPGTKNQSDSDISDGSPGGSSSLRPISAQELFAEAAALEKDETDVPNGVVADGDGHAGNEKMSPATKLYNFRRKKRPWSMHNIMFPVTTPTPTKTDNPLLGGLVPEGDNTNRSNSKPGPLEQSDSSNETPAPVTYRARSNSLARSPRLRSHERSLSVSGSQQSVVSESNSESCSESSTPVCSPKMNSARKTRGKNPHARSATTDPSHGKRSSHSESGVEPERVEGALTDIVSPTRESDGRARSSGRKTTSPISLPRQPRPRLLNFDTAVSDNKRPSTAPANCRDSRHLSARPALPAPSRVSPRPLSLTTSPVPLGGPLTEEEGDIEEEEDDDVDSRQGVLLKGHSSTPDGSRGDRSTESGKGKDGNKLLSPTVPAKADRKQVLNRGRKTEEAVRPSSASPRRATSKKTVPNGGIGSHHLSAARAPTTPNERLKQAKNPLERRRTPGVSKPTSGDPSKRDLAAVNKSDGDRHRETTSNPSLGSPPGNDDRSSIDRGSSTLPRKVKMRHTVIYKEKSPLLKKTLQPVSLLPPTIEQLRSQTLPARSKLARQLSNASFFHPKVEGRVSPDKMSRLDKNPENIRTIDRRVLNLPAGPSPTSTPIPEIVAEESPAEEQPLEETDSPPDGSGEELIGEPKLARQATEDPTESTATSSATTTTTAAGAVPTSVRNTENRTSPSPTATPIAPSSSAAVGSRKSSLSSSLNWKRIHERRPVGGGLKRALSAYQENRRETARVRKSLDETRKVSDTGVRYSSSANVSADIERRMLLSPDPADERLSVSECNSPELRRRKMAESNSRSSWSHLFSPLRWRSAAPSDTARPRSTGDFEIDESPNVGLAEKQSASVPPTPHELSQEFYPSQTSSPLPGQAPACQQQQQVSSTPGSPSNKWRRTHGRSLSSQSALKVSPISITYTVANRSDTGASKSDTDSKQSDTSTSALPPSARVSVNRIHGNAVQSSHHQAAALKRVLTPTDSESVKTLTESKSHLQQSTKVELPHVLISGAGNSRQTCSSVESEGLGSLTSEELSLEDLVHQDWSQWSKEELVKELIHSKQRLKGMEDELVSVKGYLDNLLLRIMETNPSILSATP